MSQLEDELEERLGEAYEFWPELAEADVLQSYSLVGGSGTLPLAVGNWWEFLLQEGVHYAVAVEDQVPVAGHLLLGNAPNPFNPATEITFVMASRAPAFNTSRALASFPGRVTTIRGMSRPKRDNTSHACLALK